MVVVVLPLTHRYNAVRGHTTGYNINQGIRVPGTWQLLQYSTRTRSTTAVPIHRETERFEVEGLTSQAPW